MIQNPNQPPQRRGAQTSTATVGGAGNITLLAGGSNPNGAIVRTCVLFCTAANTEYLVINTFQVAGAFNGGLFNYMGPGFFVPAGTSIAVENSAAGGYYAVSWDLL